MTLAHSHHIFHRIRTPRMLEGLYARQRDEPRTFLYYHDDRASDGSAAGVS